MIGHEDDTRWCKLDAAATAKSSDGPGKPTISAAIVRNVVGVKVGVVRVGIPPQFRLSSCKIKI